MNAAEFIATEVAWNGSATDAWVARKLTAGGYTEDPALIVQFAIDQGLLKPIPRLGGYVTTRRVDAAIFGRRFVEWIDAKTAA